MSTPAQIYDSAVQWIGPHSAISLSKVLKKIACEEKSGDLQVSFGRGTKTIYLKQGSVVFAASDITEDRLGETMLDRGSISEYEYILASSMMKTEGRRFGEALVRIGLINKEELERQLRHQFNRIVLSLFQLREGIYSFEERSPSIPNDLMVDLAIPYLLLDGLRSISDDRLLLSCLPFTKSKLRATTRPFSDFDVSMLTPEELTVLRVAREGTRLETILSEVRGDSRNILRSCGALSVLGFLEVERDQGDEDDLSELVMMTYSRTEDMTESQTLELDPDAGPSDVERAYTLKRLEWTQIHELVKGDPELEPRVTEIQFRLAAAYHRLMIDEPPRLETNNVLRPSKPGTTPRPKTGAQKLDPKPAAKTAAPTENELLNEVRIHFNAKDWDAAIPVLFRLVELEPRNATYRGLLAKAMFKHPTLRVKAERHFLEAIQLKPLDPKLHLWLGLYYKSFGQSSRAATAFRTALELDPDNTVAKKYLLTGEMSTKTFC